MTCNGKSKGPPAAGLREVFNRCWDLGIHFHFDINLLGMTGFGGPNVCIML